MFEKELATLFHRIFGVKKVTYNAPSEEREQEILFIDVVSAPSKVKKSQSTAVVTGNIFMYGNVEKMPFGFFTKKINSADAKDTEHLFFYNREQNGEYIGNLVERRCGFIYYYKGQYDPNAGSITTLEFPDEDEEVN